MFSVLIFFFMICMYDLEAVAVDGAFEVGRTETAMAGTGRKWTKKGDQ